MPHPQLTNIAQLPAHHSGVTDVPAKVTDNTPSSIHIDLHASVAGCSAIAETDWNGIGTWYADDSSIVAMAAAGGRTTGPTLIQVRLSPSALHMVKPDTLTTKS